MDPHKGIKAFGRIFAFGQEGRAGLGESFGSVGLQLVCLHVVSTRVSKPFVALGRILHFESRSMTPLCEVGLTHQRSFEQPLCFGKVAHGQDQHSKGLRHLRLAE